jgi:hypothetical protein
MLYLWDATDYGTPTNMDEVFKTFNQLIEKPERPSSAILAFAQRIQDLARFHQVFAEPTKQLYHNLVAQFKQHQYALHSLELPYGNYLPLLKTLGDTAAAFNLVIYDDQLGVAYLPSKKALPDNRAIDWLMQKDFLANKTFKNLKEFQNYVQPLMHDLMARYGLSFTQMPSHEKPIYIKQLEYGLQYISVGYKQDKEGDYELDGMLYIDVPFVENIYSKFDFAKFEHSTTVSMQLLYGLYSAPSSEFLREDYSKLKLKTQEDVTTRLQWFEDGFLKALAIAENIKGLDRLLNGDVNERFKSNIQGRGVYTPRCLIVARLANNPRFEELAISLATPRSPGANQESLPTEWPKLVQYLREDINPATCWQQFAQLEKEEQRLEAARLNALQRQYNPQTSEELMSLASQFYDAKTNLTWQRCCVGQQWVDGKVTGNPQLLSWDEVQKKLAQESDKGWRLPTFEELKTLIITTRIGYITKEGFDFYEIQERRFSDHWINPFQRRLNDTCTDIYMVSARNVENPTINDAPSIYPMKPNLRGSLRLVKSGL